MNDSTMAAATAASARYVAEVQQLVDAQLEVLFTLVTAGAARASTGVQPIEVTRQARSLTASAGAHTAVLRVEAITDRPKDLRLVARSRTGQARCILPTEDGSGEAWELVLERAGAGIASSGHTWMDAGAQKPLTATSVATTLRSFFP